MKLVSAETMKDLDRYTIETVGIPGVVLMETAGRACAERAADILAEHDLDSALVLCGPGNNGGDGFVAARHLSNWGFDPVVAIFGKKSSVKGDARVFLDALDHFPVPIIEVAGDLPEDALLTAAAGGMVIDAMFGTGLVREVEGRFARAIDSVNALRCPVLAVDIPSGVCSDTGRVMGTAVNADVTITFGAAKIGHFSYPGRARCGEVEVVDIGIPDEAVDDAVGAFLLDPVFASTAFQPRDAESFKNDFGHLLVVGGLSGKGGAALLASMGAVRSGSGLVTIATDVGARANIEGRFPELMVEAPFRVEGGRVDVDDVAFAGLLEGKTAIVVGPGLSTMPGADRVVSMVLEAGVPAVLDADALNIVAAGPDRDWGLGMDCVLTPHPGEAGRLLVRGSGDVQADRVTAATQLSDQTGAVVVLKGAGTLIATPDDRLWINNTGGPGLATAGTGDVLSGSIGALLARGLPSWAGASAAVFVHGLAGDLAAESMGVHSVSATDLLNRLPEAITSVCAP